jgi:hypothetical protein
LSVIRSAQVVTPPSGVHFVSELEQPPTQPPDAHTVPVPHEWPQLPQLRLSVWVFTHVGLPASTPHKTSTPCGHADVHDPLAHA